MKRVGLALGRERVWAVVRDGQPLAQERVWSGTLTGSDQSAIHAMLADLGATLGAPRAHLEVALLPDVCQVRRIALPRMRDAELRSVLARTLARHVAAAGAPQAFGADRVPGGVVVAAAPASLVSGLEDAVRAAGWRLGAVRPAECAWVAAAGRAPLLVATSDRVELLSAHDGRLSAMRRIPKALVNAEAMQQLVREVLRHQGNVSLAVIGESADVAELRAMLEGSLDAEGVLAGHAPEAIAAAFISRAAGPLVLTEERWRAQQAARRRVVRGAVTAAATLAVFAAGGAWWGAGRELEWLRSERARHGVAVAEALALREHVARMEERRAILEPLGANGGWSPVLVQIADHLPRSAFLTAFRAAGDSVTLEGFAAESGPVLESLRSAPPIAALRATAPIRRETRASGVAIERFVLSARIASPEQPR